MLDIPHPLRDVMSYEGVLDSEVFQAIPFPNSRQGSIKAIRWGIIGLPGMGKSTICKTVFHQAKGYFPIYIIPEAADYAVKIKGFSLIEFEPFLNQVYEQAESLARLLTTSRPGVIIIREPSIIQNEIYLIVQRNYQRDQSFRDKLTYFANYAQKGIWDYHKAEEISLLFSEHKERLLNLTRGPWLNSFAVLTKADPMADLRLSIDRQNNADRDPRLRTNNMALLCGYSIGINKCIRILEESGFHLFALNPDDQVEALARKLIDNTLAIRRTIDA